MYEGDRSRKQTLVDFGFRLPSALDNRPLRFDEFLEPSAAARLRLGDAGAVRARALGRWSPSRSSGRPGSIDPEVELRADEGTRSTTS